MKIGVTSQNFRTITGHAGKSRRFLIFCENAEGDWGLCDRLDLPREMSLHEFNGTEHPLFGLDVLITASCGNGFKHKLAQHDVVVHQTSEQDPLAAVKMLAAGERLPAAEAHEHHHHHHHEQVQVDFQRESIDVAKQE